MNKQKKGKRMIAIIAGLLSIFLLKSFVWDKYIVNSTADAALKGTDGGPGVGMYIGSDEKKNLTIRRLEDGFKLYGVSKGFWGWKVTEEMAVHRPEGNSLIEAAKTVFHYEQNADVMVLLVITTDPKVDRVVASMENGEEISFGRIVNGDAQLYYHYSERSLGPITFEAQDEHEAVLHAQEFPND